MECPVCWESMGTVGKATVSVPCGHFFHDDCLTQALQPMAPECPMCRSPIHDLTPNDMTRIPRDLHPYLHPALRTVFVSMSHNENADLRKETDHLYHRVEQLQLSLHEAKQREATAEGRIAAIMDLWKKEQAKNMELQKCLAEKTSAERQRRADEAVACLKTPCHAPPLPASSPQAGTSQRAAMPDLTRTTQWVRSNSQTPVSLPPQYTSATHPTFHTPSTSVVVQAQAWPTVTQDVPAGSSYSASPAIMHPSLPGNEASSQQALLQPATSPAYAPPSPRATAVAYAVPRITEGTSQAYPSMSLPMRQTHHITPHTHHPPPPTQQVAYGQHQYVTGSAQQQLVGSSQQHHRQRSLMGDARERQMMSIQMQRYAYMQQQQQQRMRSQNAMQAVYAQTAGQSQWEAGPSS